MELLSILRLELISFSLKLAVIEPQAAWGAKEQERCSVFLVLRERRRKIALAQALRRLAHLQDRSGECDGTENVNLTVDKGEFISIMSPSVQVNQLYSILLAAWTDLQPVHICLVGIMWKSLVMENWLIFATGLSVLFFKVFIF